MQFFIYVGLILSTLIFHQCWITQQKLEPECEDPKDWWFLNWNWGDGSVPFHIPVQIYLIWLIEVKFMYHKINHFKVFNSVAVCIFIVLCSHHVYVIPKHFHHPKRKQHIYWAITLHSSFSSPCFLSIDLPVLDMS